MAGIPLSDIEVASPSVVMAAAHDFAAALAETPQFRAFDEACVAVSQDALAQQALTGFQAKAEALRAMRRLNTVTEADRAELERLRQDYLTRPSVQAYAAAEAELTALCQQAAAMISAAVGLNYAAACGTSCCG